MTGAVHVPALVARSSRIGGGSVVLRTLPPRSDRADAVLDCYEAERDRLDDLAGRGARWVVVTLGGSDHE